MCSKRGPSSFRCSGAGCTRFVRLWFENMIPSTRGSPVLSQSLILTLCVCMAVAVLRVKLEYRAPWDPWTENKNVRGHVSKGKHGCKCPGCLPIASTWKKGYFCHFMFFTIRVLSGCLSSLFASCWHEVLIFSLLSTLGEERLLNLPRYVCHFCPQWRQTSPPPLMLLSKRRCGYMWRCIYLSSKPVCPCREWLLHLHPLSIEH